MTNNLTVFSFDKEVKMSWYFRGDMPYGYKTVKETIFNFNGTRIWIDFQWGFFCFHLNCNFFSHFGICPRSIFVNMVAPWSNSCSEWIFRLFLGQFCYNAFRLVLIFLSHFQSSSVLIVKHRQLHLQQELGHQSHSDTSKRYKYRSLSPLLLKKGRTNLISDDFTKKIETIMIGTRAAGTAT